ncbi:hypothetical protein VCR31J2_1280195 [Vibrio coralliirubri]|uniref:Uncharacterized protein n=1 Tax=Vibrio coralliirubri TaxID=1516159 RepID=A0AA87BZS2_9VIBR|nr:hypothetical protein VCR6J2_380031 [Vibrio coralliirubri]CDT38155.1 hypothetical protein VCR1J2_450079 [Vibrio coralliirubri]CDT44075.1 hypothetical protein VCR4J2_550033 [Vibrio coralliirubri]CDT68731.1 hypothetical protein VCR31J2_1280195 [Vibrio coralliirubri]CDT85588.1 hypothetical protein VCR26J2_420032 [Vibrio coralliirubri]
MLVSVKSDGFGSDSAANRGAAANKGAVAAIERIDSESVLRLIIIYTCVS